MLFSYHTRRYLRRRAWRYFRQVGYRRPKEYVAAVAKALVLYRDEDLARGENILDSWGLVHVCFRGHPALEFTASTVVLREGRNLGELQPAPEFAELWREASAASVLLELIFTARSRLVRVWSMQLLRREHLERLQDLPVEELLRLIDHTDEEIQQFGADLLQSSKGIQKWPLETWLELLETQNPTALSTICEAMRVHVSGSRLDLAQCLKLTCASRRRWPAWAWSSSPAERSPHQPTVPRWPRWAMPDVRRSGQTWRDGPWRSWEVPNITNAKS